jgi:hypothetical protein
VNPESSSKSRSAQHHFQADQPCFYKICIEGVLDPKWAPWFEGLTLTTEGNNTVIAGWITDPPALYGLLTTISDLGMALISVERKPVQSRT